MSYRIVGCVWTYGGPGWLVSVWSPSPLFSGFRLSSKNLPVALRYSASAIVFFSFDRMSACFISSSPFFGPSFLLSRAYAGHSRRKYWGVFLLAPHAGHCALSFLLNRNRYAFSGTCPARSWNILLASVLDILGLLISFMKRREGIEESILWNLAYRGDATQSCLHLIFLAVLSSWIAAVLLRLSGFLSILGS